MFLLIKLALVGLFTGMMLLLNPDFGMQPQGVLCLLISVVCFVMLKNKFKQTQQRNDTPNTEPGIKDSEAPRSRL